MKAKAKREGLPRQDTKQIVMPTVSQGTCRNALRKNYLCQNFDTELANGLCVECWDKSTDVGEQKGEQQ
jgi:hypothetical protein